VDDGSCWGFQDIEDAKEAAQRVVSHWIGTHH